MKFEFSAGGIVFKQEGEKVVILLAQHSQHHGWVFPKGLIGDNIEGEGKEETAVREVKEETGIDAEILQSVSPITFWYVFQGEKRKKTVYYYIMRHLGGDTTKRDDEMEQVVWVPVEDVVKKLTYPSDKKIWEEAMPLIISQSS